MVRCLQEPDYPIRLTLAPPDELTLDDSPMGEVASCANHSCTGRTWTPKRPPTGRLTNGAGTAIILLCLYPHSLLKTTVGNYATLKSIWPEDAFRAGARGTNCPHLFCHIHHYFVLLYAAAKGSAASSSQNEFVAEAQNRGHMMMPHVCCIMAIPLERTSRTPGLFPIL
jgi:hypothetical protein